MSSKVVVTGAAGLLGQNLIPRLKASVFERVVAIDKHPANVRILKALHPDLQVIEADLAEPGVWQDAFDGCTHLVIGHAQIGGLYTSEYVRNNVTATERVLEAALRAQVRYAVSVSSSVVNSMATDDYTETKKAQEKLVASSGIKQVVLRPTLMFGWFDRKHVGWLARFMQKVPVFPIPGSGKFLRQPLFCGDFCDIIVSALSSEVVGTFNISGQQKIDYIDLIRALKRTTAARTTIVRIPYTLFSMLLKLYAVFDKNPAFTARQLDALVTPDVFEVIDWPATFGVRATPLEDALNQTFCDPTYSHVVLEF